ncbi:ABC transporter permease [Micromonospora sp. STR1s_5]|nr:ABC transporter permease [Micromonospora sp. STR1s_5]
MIRFEPRAGMAPARSVGLRLLAVAAALVLARHSAAGWQERRILPAYATMLQGAAGTIFALTETLTRATPLIFTGLAAAIAFRARLYNIGAEGQLYLGALATVAVGSGAIEGPPALLVPLVLLAAAAAGAALMLGPTILKARFGVDEVVTTLLLNFVVLLFIQMMLEGRSRTRWAAAGHNRSRSCPRRRCPRWSSACASMPACRSGSRSASLPMP